MAPRSRGGDLGRGQLAAAAAVLALLTGCAGSVARPANPDQTSGQATMGLEVARGFRVRRG